MTERRRVRVALSILAGLLIAAAVPPLGWWPLALVGVGLWTWLSDRPSWRERFWVGALVGVAWFEPPTLWMVKFSPVGWPLGVAVWFGLLGGLVSALCPPGRWRLPAMAALLVVAEWVRWHAPFGGVPLAMLAMTQGDGPLLPTARVLGSLGVSASVAVAGVAVGALTERRWWFAAGGSALVVVLALGGVVAPRGEATGTLEVAAIQGGGDQETRSESTDYAEVFRRHVEVTEEVDEPVDLIVWPENVINLATFQGSPQEAAVEELARRFDATVVAGIVEDAGSDHFLNAVVAVAPDGEPVGRYDKVRRVPYGEYVPLRFMLEPIAGSLLPPRDQIPGTDPNVLDTPAGRLGVVVSWEVFFPRRVRAAVTDDAEVILNPTNGSSYWLTQVQTQQLASSALRAVESGRWVVQSAPTGFSAFVDPSGDVVARTDIGEAAALQHRVERRDGRTIAMRVGDVPVLMGAAVALALAWGASRRSRRPGPEAVEEPASHPLG